MNEILIVEKDKYQRELIQKACMRAGIVESDIALCISGETAEQILREAELAKKPFGLVIVSEELPGRMTGLDVAATAWAFTSKTKHETKTVLLTSSPPRELEALSAVFHVSAVALKPNHMRDLEEIVRHCLKLGQKGQRPPEKFSEAALWYDSMRKYGMVVLTA